MGQYAHWLEDHKWVHVKSDEAYRRQLRRTWFEIGYLIGALSMVGVGAVLYLIWWFHHLH